MLKEGFRPDIKYAPTERRLSSVDTGVEYTRKSKSKPARESRGTYIRRRIVVGGTIGVAAAIGSHFLHEELRQDCVPATHTVKAGDTLWEIGKETHPDVDPREAVSRIRHANDLKSAVIQQGDELEIPCS